MAKNKTQDMFASDSGHWYAPNGDTAYTTVGKNGEVRATTLRDAKKDGLLPSVTTILKEAAAPMLDGWKQRQVLYAALTLSRMEGESDDDFVKRILHDSKQEAIDAAERGQKVHGWIEQGFQGTLTAEDGIKYFELVSAALLSDIGTPQVWVPEKSFACGRYGGKVDLHNNDFVLDFKTKGKSIDNEKLWDNHHMQLAAYRHGLNLESAKCGIVFVSVPDVTCKIVWAEEADLNRGYNMFDALCSYWYEKNRLYK